MPILETDIKLLKSAVMADTPDGGGAMTGVPVVDGQSNNIFPDTSVMDRALGRFATRKLFGVAHTSDTDTLMGTHVIVTDAPDDPLVHCALFKTSGWATTIPARPFIGLSEQARRQIGDTLNRYIGTNQ